MPVSQANHVLSTYWDNKIPVDPIIIAKNMGLKVYSSNKIEYEGEYFVYDGVPTIVYSPSGNLRRDRFTIAHELGHHALGHGGNPHRDTAASFLSHAEGVQERAANKFAAELLMPTKAVKFAVLEAGLTSIAKLCQYFDVSNVAMRIRLEGLGML